MPSLDVAWSSVLSPRTPVAVTLCQTPSAPETRGGCGTTRGRGFTATTVRVSRRTVPVLGFHPSIPPSTLSIVYSRASVSVGACAHPTRFSVVAPGPLLAYSAYRTVFSRAGSFQLFQPSGRTASLMTVFSHTVADHGRQGRPRKVRTPGSPVMRQRWKT